MLSNLQIEEKLVEFWDRTYLGNSYERWAIALGVLVLAFLALGVIKRVLKRYLKRLSERTATDVDDLALDLVRRTKRFFLFILALYIAHHLLDWQAARVKPEELSKVEKVIRDAVMIGFWLQVGIWGVGLVKYAVAHAVRGKSADDPARTMGVGVLSFVGSTIVWSVVMLTCLAALGQPVGPLIASLGVGGIAVALALQNVLGDLFASIAILLDKPFVVGDAVQIGEFNGNIERIGVKTTRLRSVNGEEIVMGNNDLVSSRIRNFKRLSERRIVLTVGVEYDTPVEIVERIPALLKEIIESTPNTRFDRAHFQKFGPSSLDFEAVYFSVLPEYNVLMDVQQAVNLAVLKRFAEAGVAFAFPTQTVRHVVRGAASGEAVEHTGVPEVDVKLQSVAAHAMKKQIPKPT